MNDDKLVQIGADAAHIALQMEYGADFNRNVLLRLTRAALAAAIPDLERERDELRAALKPFSEWLDRLEPEFGDHGDDIIVGGLVGAIVTFGDLRRARAALEAKP